MNNFVTLLIGTFLMLLWSGICLATGADPAALPATVAPATPEVLPTTEWIMMLIKAIGGFKGMSALGIAAAVSQLLLKGLQTPLAKYAGKYKITAVTGLTLVSGITSLMVASDISFMAALMHSTTLAAFQVFVHQLWKQFTKKDETKEEPKEEK